MTDRNDELDPILRDIIPYCSDVDFITEQFEISMEKSDSISYLDEMIENEKHNSKVDLRILLSRILKERSV